MPGTLARRFANLAFGGRCFLCRGAAGAVLCAECDADLPRLVGPLCPRCALAAPAGEVCGRCLAHPPAYDATVAALGYEFPADALVQALQTIARGGIYLPVALLAGSASVPPPAAAPSRPKASSSATPCRRPAPCWPSARPRAPAQERRR